MGAQTFRVNVFGKTAQDAYNEAVQQAHYEYGHAGYTGTIAEKDGFTIVEAPNGLAEAFVDAVESGADEAGFAGAAFEKAVKIHDDKWGPALCVPTGKKNKSGKSEFIFAGWASS